VVAVFDVRFMTVTVEITVTRRVIGRSHSKGLRKDS